MGVRALLAARRVHRRGESAEEAVAREIFEESGLRVEAARYIASQPWPFPRSFMLGFSARLAEESIQRSWSPTRPSSPSCAGSPVTSCAIRLPVSASRRRSLSPAGSSTAG
ncbi:NUDIX domain-containing protein [Leucobacter soli]|uniref:NUDIX domain-containing protein n=1 Tax=Leucobacter soli TaxID=2812850 RepID=UPI00360D4143